MRGSPITHDAPERPYRHLALMYAGPDDLVRRTVPFLRDGAAAGEPTLVVVGRHKIDLLRKALGHDGASIEFADMNDVGANPARIIPAWQEFVAAHPGRTLRGIGEPIYPERSPAELVECQHHERLLNPALDGSSLTLVCPYDTEALDASVIEEALRSHPRVSDDHGERRSDSYASEETGALLASDLPEPPATPRTVAFSRATLGELRGFVEVMARTSGLDPARHEDLVLAVHELATNSIRHGGGAGTLRAWCDADALICEVRDRGHIDDPLVDRRRPQREAGGGYGLWIANRLCDLVQVRSGAGGSVVRLHMRLR